MKPEDSIKNKIFKVSTPEEFNDLALEIFHFQYKRNKVYQEFVDFLGINAEAIKQIINIPFLPIELFKTQKIITGKQEAEQIFYSSGTTQQQISKHYLTDINLYEKSFLHCFTHFYGNPGNFCLLALLPSYLEQESSSLIYMVNSLIQKTNCSHSGFFLYDYEKLVKKITKIINQDKNLLLLGVSFALLELAEKHNIQLPENAIVLETGGMKGRRKEITRAELHKRLCDTFGIREIHSEYGMTELLSQAYSKGQGRFKTPSWMEILIRDLNDPLTILPEKSTGGINIIDLANLNSCCFIATQDIGKNNIDGSFEVLGRYDHSDIRGCNLLVT